MNEKTVTTAIEDDDLEAVNGGTQFAVMNLSGMNGKPVPTSIYVAENAVEQKFDTTLGENPFQIKGQNNELNPPLLTP